MRAIGIVLVASALAIGVVPQLTHCSALMPLAGGGGAPMRCHYTAMAELGVAGPLLLAGVWTLVGRRRETLRVLSSVAAVSGLFALLLPTALIGVCANDAMLCNLVMRPTLVLAGLVTLGAALLGFLLAGRPQLAPEKVRRRP